VNFQTMGGDLRE